VGGGLMGIFYGISPLGKNEGLQISSDKHYVDLMG
jgi:hypothetical protein